MYVAIQFSCVAFYVYVHMYIVYQQLDTSIFCIYVVSVWLKNQPCKFVIVWFINLLVKIYRSQTYRAIRYDNTI